MALVFLNFPQTKQWGAQIVRGRWPGWLSLDFQLIIPGYLYRRTTKRVLTSTFGGTSRSTVLESSGCQYISMYIWVFPKIGFFTPKWMVKIMENPIKMDDLGGKPTIFGNTHFRDAVGRNPSPVVLFPIWPASVETAGPFRSDGCASDLPG